MPSMGLQIAAEVGQAMLAARLKREAEEAKAGKGPKMQPGKFGKTPDTFNRGPSEQAYQQQRAGEREDFGGPRATPEDMPTAEPMQPDVAPAADPQLQSGFEMSPEMGMSVYGSGKFSHADIMRGYRSLGKA